MATKALRSQELSDTASDTRQFIRNLTPLHGRGRGDQGPAQSEGSPTRRATRGSSYVTLHSTDAGVATNKGPAQSEEPSGTAMRR